MAHQWFGNLVTPKWWDDIWLNEGFARYSEALWLEFAYGAEGYWGKMDAIRYYGDGTIHVPDLNDWDRIFDVNLTYNKAGWVLHMIRGALGDLDFFDFLTAYRQSHEYGAATTEDFIAVLNDFTGEDYTAFINQWIYEEYFPVYEPAWESIVTREGDELHLTITQLQTNTVIFEMPMTVRVSLEGGGSVDFTVQNNQQTQEYVFALPAAATEVALDPDDWILKRVSDPIINPSFSDGVLLVNGVSWETYAAEIDVAYENEAFWGELEIDFWDYFQEPAGGYPSTLPPVLGHGSVPSAVLGNYSTVIWVGNNYAGDINGWENTNISGYLAAGGNVLLMTRQGDAFLNSEMRDYLGVTGLSNSTIYDCISVFPQLTTIARIGTQSYCSTFSSTLTLPTSTLLYQAEQNFTPDRGIGVWRKPDEGGTYNPDGGQFVFLSGRPYRWNSADLSANIEIIVNDLFANPQDIFDDGLEPARLSLRLQNPAREKSVIHFDLPATSRTSLAVYDAEGRMIRSLYDAHLESGPHSFRWDGNNAGGSPITAGVYYVRLATETQQQVRPLLILR